MFCASFGLAGAVCTTKIAESFNGSTKFGLEIVLDYRGDVAGDSADIAIGVVVGLASVATSLKKLRDSVGQMTEDTRFATRTRH